MKRFVKAFAACLAGVMIFLGFGGFMLFDFRNHFFLAGASVAFLLAVFVTVWYGQEVRLENLEKRIRALEPPEESKDSDLENKENAQ